MSTHSQDHKIWSIIPAAGVGARFGASLPKQYSVLAGKTVLEHALAAISADPRVQSVGVGIAPHDEHFINLRLIDNQRYWHFNGGASRRDTVLNGLNALASRAHDEDWVLVHDAARPLLHPHDLANLIDCCVSTNSGAILAAPSVDTLKYAQDKRVERTLDRRVIWRAQTPQCFKVGYLREALIEQRDATDESAAIEARGGEVAIVESKYPNLKITVGDDLDIAEALLLKRKVVQ